MFTFEYWRGRGLKGDDFAAGLMWSTLLDAVRQREPSHAQWEVLIQLLTAISKSSAHGKLRKAANRAVGVGRRPGRKQQYQVDADRYQFASEVFDRFGEVRGKDLEDACHAVITEMRGFESPVPPDLRAPMDAYREHLPLLLYVQQLSRENDARDSHEIPP